jgi:hypothetical protein
MKYTEIYNSTYLSAYIRLEKLTKNLFISLNKEDRSYDYALNTFSFEGLREIDKRLDLIYHMPGYTSIMEKFELRNKNYTRNAIENVFVNDIYNAFVEIPKEKLPKNYNFNKLVFDFAVIQAYQNLQSTAIKNSALLELIYKLERFELFEIKEITENTIFKNELYIELSNTIQHPKTQKRKIVINANLQAENLFEYLVQNYKTDNFQSVKFINIWYFLDRDCDEKFVFEATINEYKAIVEKKYKVVIKKFEKSPNYNEKIKPILRDLESLFKNSSP